MSIDFRKNDAATYLTAVEAAIYLRVSKRHLEKLYKGGKIPCSRLGDRVLFSRQALDAFMDKGGVA